MDISEKASIKKRLIDANELIKEANADGAYGYVDAKQIADAPTIEAVPVRHGEWEIVVGSNGKEYMVCTCCRVSQDLTGVFSYCPNCGAKMDGGAD